MTGEKNPYGYRLNTSTETFEHVLASLHVICSPGFHNMRSACFVVKVVCILSERHSVKIPDGQDFDNPVSVNAIFFFN